MRIIKIESLPGGKQWIDRDEIMLHSCFQILKNCVEKEKVDTHCSYETHKEFVDEVRYLYEWWKKRSLTIGGTGSYLEDNTMLLRLMQIRTSLWT